MFSHIKKWIFGSAQDPLHPETRRRIALVAFLAWIGLGADGLSSSCYGPEEAFLALGAHHHLAIYLALATTLTVFLIAFAYNQVIKLFPSGGGGYRVATQLIGPYAGLISGAALIIDYTLTIAISVASGTDALFSLLNPSHQNSKLFTEVAILIFMVYLNLRGTKESIKILMPIFLGFFISHIIIIGAGVFSQAPSLPNLFTETYHDTLDVVDVWGWIPVLALLFRAYSLGAGTYTGIEAVSNNVHILAEPRVQTGRWTMFYMAVSLSVVAGGIIMLYLLWHVHPAPGKTLNAAVFQQILGNLPGHRISMFLLLLSEAGILFVAANTGFLGGPSVLANMSMDEWVPKRFSSLSSRLVTQNGILVFGIAAMLILLWSHGSVAILVVLYSINVFLTFTMTFLGLIVYQWSHRGKDLKFLSPLFFSTLAFIICGSILAIVIIEKFTLGGWLTLTITGATVVSCYYMKKHYIATSRLKRSLDRSLTIPLHEHVTPMPITDKNKLTAIFLVKRIGATMHSLLWMHRLFPHHFHNIVFISHGVVDIGSFGSDRKIEKLKSSIQNTLNYLIKFCNQHGYAADAYSTFGTDPLADITELTLKLSKEYPNCIVYAARYLYPNETWLTRMLHSNLATMLQKRLQDEGIKMLVLPLSLGIEEKTKS